MGAVIVGYCRTPFQRAHRGALKDTRPEDMAATVVRGVLERTGISGNQIEKGSFSSTVWADQTGNGSPLNLHINTVNSSYTAKVLNNILY